MRNGRFLRLMAVLALFGLLFAGCSEEKAEQSEVQTTTQAPQPTDDTANSTLPTSTTLGGRAPNLTFTDAQGDTITLESLLGEKKLVVLNFWFADCGWCRREFPVMEVSYQRFREDVEILALNPYDSQQTIAAFQEESSLSFPMLSCSPDLARAFGVNGYPTSVCIDREGTISLIHAGAITDTAVFDKLFETYTASDYRSRVFNSVNELLD